MSDLDAAQALCDLPFAGHDLSHAIGAATDSFWVTFSLFPYSAVGGRFAGCHQRRGGGIEVDPLRQFIRLVDPRLAGFWDNVRTDGSAFSKSVG